jgi:ATP-dependent RNA helicase DDX56/DBP9
MVVPSASNGTLDPSTSFVDLANNVNLDIRLLKAISKLSYTHPTLIQAKCIPLSILQGRDILVHAKTGCGKTLAYAIPIIHKILCEKKIATIENHCNKEELNRNNNVKAIVLLPTRELCNQVAKVLQNLTYYCDDVVAIVALLGFSGKNNNRGDHCYHNIIFQEEVMLRDKPDIIVGTPSGLLHHIQQNDDCQNNI